MEEFRKIIIDAIEVLRKKKIHSVLDLAYNTALDDVIDHVIKRIPN